MKNLCILFASTLILMSCSNVDSTKSVEEWVVSEKTFCKKKASVVAGTFYFYENKTFKLVNEGRPGGTSGHDFNATHSGTFSVKSGKYWESKDPYYYLDLTYNDTKWAGPSRKGYLVYDDGELVTPTTSGHTSVKDDNNGFKQFYINIALNTNKYVKCN